MSSALESAPGSTPSFALADLKFLRWVLIVAVLAIPSLKVIASHTPAVPSIQGLEGDFVYFYGMGRMFNEYPASRLYDYELQKKVYTEVYPLQATLYGPNPYSPFIGVVFRPFARLPFHWAFVLWGLVSVSLYLGGLVLVTRRFFPDDRYNRSLIFCFALTFYPFVTWIMASGQISTIGFFAFALAFWLEGVERPFLSGLALSLCVYKPTLLVLFVPMLLTGRRYKTLGGLALGAVGLASLATAAQGAGIWFGYIKLMASFGSGAMSSHSFRVLWHYIDLGAFSALIPGGRSWPVRSIIFVFACYAGLCLMRAWRKSNGAGSSATALVWAATLTWTLILNAYVPVYDSLLAVISLVATAGIFKGLPQGRFQLGLKLLWLLIAAFSWITEDMARLAGLQIVTVLFVALGFLQLAILDRRRTTGLRFL